MWARLVLSMQLGGRAASRRAVPPRAKQQPVSAWTTGPRKAGDDAGSRAGRRVCFASSVHLFFDESGDYAFPADHFDCYVQGALLCPDKLIPEIEEFVGTHKTAWSVEELHAAELTSAQLIEVAQFIAGSELSGLAQVTDTELVTCADIERYRLDQAAGTKRNLNWYRRESTKARGAPVPEIEQWMDRMIKRAGLTTQISHGEFIQAQFLVNLIRDALQKATLVYCLDEWRDDSWDFHFMIDGKLPAKMAAGEKYLNDMLVPALGSQHGATLGMLDTWKAEPVHPFIEKYSLESGRIRGREVEGVTDLGAIFRQGLRFEPSHEHAGLQLIDAMVYTVRRAVIAPDDPEIQWAYDLLRPSLLNEGRRALTLHRLRGSDTSERSLERYRRLHAERRLS